MLTQLGACELTPKEELQGRIGNLKRLMSASGIDFAVIMQNADLLYFTGSMQKGTFVIPLEGEPIFFVQRSIERAQMETSIQVTGVKTDKDTAKMLRDKGILKGRGGMEFDVVPVSVFERLKGLLGFDDFSDISGLIKGLRLVKSPFELEQVRRSGAICERVFAKAREVIREGRTEVDIDAELVAEGRKHGHQGFLRMRGFNQEMMNLYVISGFTGAIHSFNDVPVAGIGVTPAIPQGSSMKKVERGIPVTVDYGGGYNGYVTDETRPFVVGKLNETFRRPYEVARMIIEDTQALGKEGVDCTEIFMRAYETVKKEGLEDHFMGFGDGQVTFIGHGLGLEINELPVITPRHHMVLKEGMVFAFEPKFVFPDKGVIGIEVDFIARKDGLERVTTTPVDLVVL
ncbi:MAG TPA: Xaa-Pro peptidase family protein [Methanoregula sp.]|nr:Xaa-Pro peptidase family protein [Methanoregula sp.]